MRCFAAIVFLWLAMANCFAASTGTIVCTNSDFQQTAQKVRSVFVYYLDYGPDGTNLVTKDRVDFKTDTTGYFAITNFRAGHYRFEFQGTKEPTTNFFEFPATNGTVNAGDQTYWRGPTNAPNVMPIAQGDGRYIRTFGLHQPTNLPTAGQVLASPDATNLAYIDPGTASFSGNANQFGVDLDGKVIIKNGARETNVIFRSGSALTSPGLILEGPNGGPGLIMGWQSGQPTFGNSVTLEKLVFDDGLRFMAQGSNTTKVTIRASDGTVAATNFVGAFTGNGAGLTNVGAFSNVFIQVFSNAVVAPWGTIDISASTTHGLQEAINALPQVPGFNELGGGTIQLPPGTNYLDCTSQITIPNNFPFYLKIIGNGAVVRYIGSTAQDFIVTSYNPSFSPTNTLHLEVDSAIFSYASNYTKYIWNIGGLQFGRFTHCTFARQYALYGVAAFQESDFTVKPGPVGVFIKSAQNPTTYFYDCTFTGLAAGIYSQGDNLLVQDCVAIGVGAYYSSGWIYNDTQWTTGKPSVGAFVINEGNSGSCWLVNNEYANVGACLYLSQTFGQSGIGGRAPLIKGGSIAAGYRLLTTGFMPCIVDSMLSSSDNGDSIVTNSAAGLIQPAKVKPNNISQFDFRNAQFRIGASNNAFTVNSFTGDTTNRQQILLNGSAQFVGTVTTTSNLWVGRGATASVNKLYTFTNPAVAGVGVDSWWTNAATGGYIVSDQGFIYNQNDTTEIYDSSDNSLYASPNAISDGASVEGMTFYVTGGSASAMPEILYFSYRDALTRPKFVYTDGTTSMTISNNASVNFSYGSTNFLTVVRPNGILFGYLNADTSGSSTIAGGIANSSGSASSFMGGGISNTIGTLAAGEFIGGGIFNQIATHAVSATPNSIVGGSGNVITLGSASTIGGGGLNYIDIRAGGVIAQTATIGGGLSNTNRSSYGTIPGGRSNTVSADYAFAAGYRAIAGNQGAFVWGDSTDAVKASAASDTFNIFSAGGGFVDLGTSTWTNRGSMQITNSLVIGTNGPIHLTNIWQVATVGNRNIVEVATDNKVFINAQLTVTGITNSAVTASALVIADANKKEIGLANGGANTFVEGTSPPVYRQLWRKEIISGSACTNGVEVPGGVAIYCNLFSRNFPWPASGFTNSAAQIISRTTGGYLSNLTFGVNVPFPATTNIDFKLRTNVIPASGMLPGLNAAGLVGTLRGSATTPTFTNVPAIADLITANEVVALEFTLSGGSGGNAIKTATNFWWQVEYWYQDN